MKNTKINARHLIIDLFLSSAYPQLSIKQTYHTLITGK
ncbi:hypothetical protein J532_4152 [Acinetobacter baumannii 940793]|nr:hypothetical protein J532_4152 [Acinetobacter baumannii 940793]